MENDKETQALIGVLDKRFVGQKAFDDAIDGVNGSMGEVKTSLAAITKNIEKLTAAPGILHDEYKDGANGPKILVTRALLGAWSQRKFGRWPTGRNANEAREYRLAKEYFEASMAPNEEKAFTSLTTTTGGFLIPEEWEMAVVPTLKAQSVVFAMGPTIREMTRDTMNWPAFNAKKSFTWEAENSAPSEGTPTTRNIVFTPKKTIGTSAVSTEWLEDADASANESLRQELLGEMAEWLDLSLLETQSGGPTGLSVISGITSIGSNADATDGGEIGYDDLSRAVYEQDKANLRPPYAWLAHPRTKDKLRRLKDENGVPYFVPDRNAPTQITPFGFPLFTSSQMSIAQTKGALTTASYMLLVRPDEVVVARRRGITIDMSEHAQFEKDQVMIRITGRFDINVKHAAAVVKITGIA